MKFGPVPLAEAAGAILAHSAFAGGRRIAKGSLLAREDLEALAAAGLAQVTVARLEPGDVGEAEAARRLGAALVPDPRAAGLSVSEPVNGRVNIHATGPGLLDVDAARVLALNACDPAITLATLAPLTRVGPGVLVATAKIITYAVPGAALDRACALAGGALRLRPVVLETAGLILTDAPGQTARLGAKGRAAVEKRLRALGMRLAAVREVPHDASAIAGALSGLAGDILLILTGAATSDPADDAPAAVRMAGGRIERFGMPVDPGNLLFLGRYGDRPVIGLPGCARSPALNGADWVLERLACGLAVTGADIAAMGVGGLLKEIKTRPHPREG
ncbi:MAG: molybdopterin-binding protein [Rhodobacteraceae bacterium]|nr:molybdopterin-binding protein [Paracoccaceae bacterium]